MLTILSEFFDYTGLLAIVKQEELDQVQKSQEETSLMGIAVAWRSSEFFTLIRTFFPPPPHLCLAGVALDSMT
jgi:hypothetical protein